MVDPVSSSPQRPSSPERRRFIGRAAILGGSLVVGGAASRVDARADDAPGAVTDAPSPSSPPAPPFRISLAEWSLHRAIRSGELAPEEFPARARREWAIDAVEYVNTFLMKDAAGAREPRDAAWFAALRRRCDDAGVRSLLIMCDGLGELGHPDATARAAAVDRHKPWLEIAKGLGCHSIRVNAGSRGTWEEQRDRAAEGLRALCEAAEGPGLDVIVENHGGLSSNGRWLAETIRAVAHPRAGTLPDFGNFDLGNGAWYDRYEGVAELMPFARGVSAKSHAFDEKGDERFTDYDRMLRIVVGAGYHGYVGIEYEGDALPEAEGIRRTKALLERVRDSLP